MSSPISLVLTGMLWQHSEENWKFRSGLRDSLGRRFNSLFPAMANIREWAMIGFNVAFTEAIKPTGPFAELCRLFCTFGSVGSIQLCFLWEILIMYNSPVLDIC